MPRKRNSPRDRARYLCPPDNTTSAQKSHHQVSRKKPCLPPAPDMGDPKPTLSKACSESRMSYVVDFAKSVEGSVRLWEHGSQSFNGEQFSVRRCMTVSDVRNPDEARETPSQYPNLLQLFNIFQFNRPEQPSSRLVVTVSLVGTLQKIRLLVLYDATVQDVIKASLKAFVKDGRLPRKDREVHAYGLHFSQFCLESIDPAEAISSLGTRDFFLHPSSTLQQQLPIALCSSKARKPSWWSALRLIFTRAANFFF